MQDIKTLEASLAICEDESKILGLTFDTTKVTPGQNIPKAGAGFHFSTKYRKKPHG